MIKKKPPGRGVRRAVGVEAGWGCGLLSQSDIGAYNHDESDHE